ncbi:MAG: SiaC family regulatory phosphoprotein [Bacteroidales bacterium]
MKPIEKFSEGEEPESGSAVGLPVVRATQDGELNITGGFVPEDLEQYLQNVREYLDDYIKHPQPTTTLTVKPDLLNGITTHYLYGIIRKLYCACDDFLVRWEFKTGDDKSFEQGQILASLCKAKFKFIRIP